MSDTVWPRLGFDGVDLDGGDVEAVVVDVEGNGHHPADIVEIALLPLYPGHDPAFNLLRSWLIRPLHPITHRAASLHGIRNTDVAGAPLWSAVADTIARALTGRLVVAHNAPVERQVLAAHLPGYEPAGWLDTLRLARAVWPSLGGGHGLDNLIGHADLEARFPWPDNGAVMTRHRAGYDTWMTAALLISLVNDAGSDRDRLVTAARLPGTQSDQEPSDQEGLW